MRVDREQAICGVKPAELKRLLQREAFSTVDAALEFGLSEPALSMAMRDLERGGWIEWRGRDRHIDLWRTADKGLRLCATRLIRRFPVPEGRAIVQRVLDKAREINADPHRSRRIVRIILFGSVLTGHDNEDAGDIDLVIEVERRRLDQAVFEALEKAEAKGWPSSLSFVDRFGRVRADMLRELKRLSPRISLHVDHDLTATGAPHRIVYAYDLDTECEQPADLTIITRERVAEEAPEPARSGKSKKTRAYRSASDRPVAPNLPAEGEHVDRLDLLRAQIAWEAGASLAAITKRTRLSSKAAQTYVAAARAHHAVPDRGDPDLRSTLETALPSGFMVLFYVEIDVPPYGDTSLCLSVLDRESYDRTARVFARSIRDMTFTGRADHFPLLEETAQVALAWCRKLRSRRSAVGLKTSFVVYPGCEALPEPITRLPDLRPLAEPMMQTLAAQLSQPLDADEAWGQRVTVELGPRCTIWFGELGYRFGERTRIRMADAPKLARTLKAFVAANPAFVSHSGPWRVYVDGRQLRGAEAAG